jgi:dipeptidyl aminopeptidase/acylaminoacyl peptidase
MRPAALFPAFLAAALLAACPAVRAQQSEPSVTDRPIVYGARYYNPPGTKGGRSLSRLFRINPDGTGRTQIAADPAADEIEPRWHPDGTRVIFMSVPAGAGEDEAAPPAPAGAKVRLLSVPAGGGPAKTLLSAPNETFLDYAFAPQSNLLAVTVVAGPDDPSLAALPRVINADTGATVMKLPARSGDVRWSPGGDRLFVLDGDNNGLILTPSAGKTVRVAEKAAGATWLGGTLWVRPADGDGLTLLAVDPATGAVKSRLALTFDAASKKAMDEDGQEPAYLFGLSSLPGDPDHVALSGVAGNSTNGKWRRRFRVDVATGATTYWGESGTVVASPDVKRYVTILGRDLAPYGKAKKPGSRVPQVWVRPLLAGGLRDGTKTGPQKPLVSGLVIVTGADWLAGSRTP